MDISFDGAVMNKVYDRNLHTENELAKQAKLDFISYTSHRLVNVHW